MRLFKSSALAFIPDGGPVEEALSRTTHLAVGAHPDDLEIMAIDGVLKCFHCEEAWFTGVVVTDGRTSPRGGVYADCDDEAMWAVRRAEQKKAAVLGEYNALIMLDYVSEDTQTGDFSAPVHDLEIVFEVARPDFVYTHNLADTHDTHVATALRVIEALRKLPSEARPSAVFGCEVWRGLDWLREEDRVAFDCSAHENLQAALLGVFDSQISGGKRYDLATLGRRRARATYHAAYDTDETTAMVYATDLTPLVTDDAQNPSTYAKGLIERFSEDVLERIARLKKA